MLRITSLRCLATALAEGLASRESALGNAMHLEACTATSDLCSTSRSMHTCCRTSFRSYGVSSPEASGCSARFPVEKSALPNLGWIWRPGIAHHAFHSAGMRRDEDGEAVPGTAINPLQQTPVPIVSQQVKESKTAYAIQRNIPMSPKKLRLFPPLLRRRHVADALVQCRVSTKKAGRICEKVLKMACANAVHNHGMSADKLVVDLAYVDNGSQQKRPWIHGRGRAGVRHKRFSHLTVVVKESDVAPVQRYRTPLLERPRKGFPPPYSPQKDVATVPV